MNLIDLRSDTVTRPGPEMRKVMANAEVGDDVYGEDPTVRRLEEKGAALLGKEAAVFVPSGTMANQISVRLHARSGTEMILETTSHIFLFEAGSVSGLSGVHPRTIPGERGILQASQIEEAVRGNDDHFPRTSLICLENTHNRGGGSIYPIGRIREIRNVAQSRKLPMHLDGARLFNAVIATGTSARDYASNFETVSFCLSKGLGAPIGSLVCSDRERVVELRRLRKAFGGGMRQVGVIAAAGLYAIENHISRLAEDHQNAKTLAKALSEIPGVQLKLSDVETNIVIFDVSGTRQNAEEVSRNMKERGILVSAIDRTRLRAVTHLDVNHKHILNAVEEFKRVLGRT